MYDCIIAGGGPSGSRTAYGLARMGLKVLVLEEHKKTGVPVHCTGIVGARMMEEFSIDSATVAGIIESVLVHFPSGKTFQLPTSIRPVLLNREKLDLFLAEDAIRAGAELRLDAKVLDALQEGDSVSVNISSDQGEKTETLRASVFVIATGAMCNLPYRCGLGQPSLFYQSVQADVEIDGISGIELFLGRSVAPGSFAYAVSTGGRVGKIGLICKKNAADAFNSLSDSPGLKGRIRRVSEGPVFRPMPFGLPPSSVKGRILSVGDAACQIKTTTGGGIYFGLLCADMLAQVAGDFIKNGRSGPGVLKKYDTMWKRALKGEISAGLALRGYLQKLDDGWWDELSLIMEESRVKELISGYRDFDNHRGFIGDFFKIPLARRFMIKAISAEFASILGFSDSRATEAPEDLTGSLPVR